MTGCQVCSQMLICGLCFFCFSVADSLQTLNKSVQTPEVADKTTSKE